MEELAQILETFAASGWELLAAPAMDWLTGRGDKQTLLAAIRRADAVCGGCGCAYDPLYKRALELEAYM